MKTKHRNIRAFTLIELLAVIAVIGILTAILLAGIGKVRQSATESKTVSNLRQLSTAVSLHNNEHGAIPIGDQSAGGLGSDGDAGRGLIWINFLAPYLGRPEIEDTLLSEAQPGLNGWEAIMSVYRNDTFVCAAFDEEELAKAKATTDDAIGGIGYNVYPLAGSGQKGPANAKWGEGDPQPIPLSRITYPTKRILFGSSYDWHLENSGVHAYDRFGTEKAAVVYFDGHTAIVNRETFDRGILNPEL